MSREPRVLSLAAAGVLGVIDQFGGDADRILGAARLDDRLVTDRSASMELRSFCTMFEEAARQTRVGTFGLRFGLQYPVESMGPCGELALNSPSLGAALRDLCRYFPAMQDHAALTLRKHGDLVSLEYQVTDGRLVERRQDAELSIGIYMNVFRRCLGADWSPEEVHFEHLKGDGSSEMRDLLKVPVHFGQKMNSIIFRPAALSAPMPNAKSSQLSQLHAVMRGKLLGARPNDFLGLVAHEIRIGLAAGDAGAEGVAHRLGLSRASLYRRLRDAGLDFTTLTQRLRDGLATMYLAEPDISVSDIAILLGYSELSAFTRAFTRRQGCSPSRYRAVATHPG
jgi:AraC-like DNA-binding protein